MTLIDTSELEELAYGLSKAKTPSDMLGSWLPLARKNKNLRAMSCLAEHDRPSVPPAMLQLPPGIKKFLIPYFEHERIYFLSDDIIFSMLTGKEVKIPVDYTICFDTNFASYVGTIVRGGDLKNEHENVISILDFIIYRNLNFDHLFYLLENTKQVDFSKTYSNGFSFWKSLRKDFRWNLVALELFRHVDCEYYKKTLSPVSQINFREAVRNAVENTYKYYASPAGVVGGKSAVENQRITLLILIKILLIQFKSKKKERAKLKELLDFMHNEIGGYFDRETVIAVMYFMERESVPFLQVVNEGGRQIRLLKKLDNLAWDMNSARFLEKLMAGKGDGDFFIPYFLTLDSKLRNLYQLYTVKSAIFDDNTGSIVPVPCVETTEFFEQNNLMKVVGYYFSDEAKESRREKGELDSTEVFKMIKSEYRSLRRYLTKSTSKRTSR